MFTIFAFGFSFDRQPSLFIGLRGRGVREAGVEVYAHGVLERFPGERQGVLPLAGGRRGVRFGLGFRLALDLQ